MCNNNYLSSSMTPNNWRQFLSATVYHKTANWIKLRKGPSFVCFCLIKLKSLTRHDVADDNSIKNKIIFFDLLQQWKLFYPLQLKLVVEAEEYNFAIVSVSGIDSSQIRLQLCRNTRPSCRRTRLPCHLNRKSFPISATDLLRSMLRFEGDASYLWSNESQAIPK